MIAKSASGFTMDITSTGASASWKPTKSTYDDLGNKKWYACANNPWGVTATKYVKIEKGRTYTISVKIKSTLKKDVEKIENVKGEYYYQTKDKSGKMIGHTVKENKTKVININGIKTRVETVTGDENTVSYIGVAKKTGEVQTVKQIHVKAYRNNEKDGDPAIAGTTIKATYKGKNVITKTKPDEMKTSYNAIALDANNDDYTYVTMKVTIPGDNIAYKQNTMGIKFAFGALAYSYEEENDMAGTIEVKDFKIVAGEPVATSKLKSVKPLKAAVKVSTARVKGAKSYEYQYATNKAFEGKKTVKARKTTVTLKNKRKIKSGKKLFVRVRAKTAKGYTVWSKVKMVKVK